MKKILVKFLILIIGPLLIVSTSFSQIELTAFGIYNLNLSYPDQGTINSDVESAFAGIADAWKSLIGPVLQQQDNFGFGARIGFNLTSSIGIEGSFEYIMAKTEIAEQIVTDIYEIVESSGHPELLDIKEAGGNIMRYYGNIVFSIPSSGKATPYITAGIGITQFKITEGTGPQVDLNAEPLAGVHVRYNDTSALTFNGGLGVKYLFTSRVGIRADARIFYCNPKFEQSLDFLFWGTQIFSDEISFTQDGAHIDTSLNLGIFARF